MHGNNFPLVSVIISAYNHEHYIQDCIRSVVAQSYPNIELLVADDGSSDKTWERLQEIKKECEKRFAIINFIRKKNEGMAATLQQLIKKSSGEYIAVIASDDLFCPKAIEKLVGFISKNKEVGLVLGKNLLISETGQQIYWGKKMKIVYDPSKAKHKSYTEFMENVSGIKTTSKEYGSYSALVKKYHICNGWLIRRSLFNQIQPFSREVALEDVWLMLQVSKIAKIKAIPDETYCYRWHNRNTVQKKLEMQKKLEDTLRYEEYSLKKSNSQKWLKLFYQSVSYQKLKFSLGFIKLYKRYSYGKKQKVWNIFGKEYM